MKIEMQNVNALILREKDWSVHFTKRNDGNIMLDLVSKYRNGQELTLVENSYNLNTADVTEIVKFLSTNFTAPWKPISPIWCVPQECGQPDICKRGSFLVSTPFSSRCAKISFKRPLESCIPI